MITLTFFIITLVFLTIFIFLNIFFNNTSARSLVAPDTDDMEESARNAKDISKILIIIRLTILIIALINSSLLSGVFISYSLLNNNFLLFTSSLFILFLLIGLIFIAAEMFPLKILKRFVIFAKLIRPVSIKIISIFSRNGNGMGFL